MIVVDASAFVELLSDERGISADVADVLEADALWLCPEHTMVETASALRGLWLGGFSTRAEFEARVNAQSRLEPTTFPTRALLPRIVELAANATAYDAAYLALAERSDSPLITLDPTLARVPGISADVHVLTG